MAWQLSEAVKDAGRRTQGTGKTNIIAYCNKYIYFIDFVSNRFLI